MKDDEKQIEEMAEDIRNELQYEIEDRSVDAYDTAFRLVRNKGWIKPSEDSVVLSRKEYEMLNYFNHRGEELLKQERNETAEKIILSEIATIKNIRDACVLPTPKYKEGYIDCCNGILFYLKNNVAKTFGIEIKE